MNQTTMSHARKFSTAAVLALLVAGCGTEEATPQGAAAGAPNEKAAAAPAAISEPAAATMMSAEAPERAAAATTPEAGPVAAPVAAAEDPATVAALAELRADVERLSQENQSLRARIDALAQVETELDERRRAMSRSEREYVALRARIEDLETTLDDSGARHGEQLESAALERDERLRESERELATAHRALAEADASIDALRARVEVLHEERLATERSEAERRGELERSLAALSEENRILQLDAEDRQTLIDELSDARRELTELRERLTGVEELSAQAPATR